MRLRRHHWLAVALILPLALLAAGCGGGGGGGSDDPVIDDPGSGDELLLTTHEKAFTYLVTDGYESAESCLGCHTGVGDQILNSGHYKWSGVTENIEGHEGEVHGKTDLINNFCIAIASNEGRCTQCHIGIGWKNTSFDFADESKIDCLVCHDTTGTYKKDLTTAGAPVASVDLQLVAESAGVPSRGNCGACHFFAGGGDNVKHPDLPSTMANPTFEQDVHMNAAGLDFSCQKCHETQGHGIAGMSLHSTEEGQASCESCHGGAPHESNTLNTHFAKVSCQACHIPAFARSLPTKMEWYWDEAGQDIADIPVDQYGKPLYNKKKGRFVFAMNVRPELLWYDGKWDRMIVGSDDQYDELPAVLAAPTANDRTPGAKLYPFKKMIGRQPADIVNHRMIVPHLFGMGPGPNPYWAKFDWGLAVAEGAAYVGQEYSGTFDFVDTVMYLTVNHEIAPKEQALSCTDCHEGGLDWTELGYPADPMDYR